MSIGSVETQFFYLNEPFLLDSGESFETLTLAYETYGTLNQDATNAILVFHALTGSQHAAGINQSVPGIDPLWTDECVLGWWDTFIGPGKALDTQRYFVICVNYLGGCYGSTGPRSTNPLTGKPYGSQFPQVSAWDVIRSQLRLLDHLGIQCLHAVIGGSMGGMLSILLATRCPERVQNVLPIATGLETTVLHRVHNFEQILAIRNDPKFQGGDYYEQAPPKDGLLLARIISHKTFVSLAIMEKRAKQEIRIKQPIGPFYELSNPIESYMFYQGKKFAERFDANSYLRIMDMWQRFSLNAQQPELFKDCAHQQYLIFSVDSDVCFYPEEQKVIVKALEAAQIDVTHITVHSDKGHDSFLLEPDLYAPYIHFVLG
ncbi:homoserine O-acetyltransferase [Leptolyngbya cf. ectocarpi LEGE 11479]|uniref:Homoserine O-acetyltransferase n=1 Tax=Leptolyngbya cf. ectocarpi LEGE 11479 TaxID=1828722 RepID=A0A929FB44_LEPEC|nr:homoserine O-acetyltransferase [Leptolyngbya ectocarpi]MBE9068694.1 homoserine O-acetyltransferase [Leptolyngbya cf. ectocarpi LEGE 11479]